MSCSLRRQHSYGTAPSELQISSMVKHRLWNFEGLCHPRRIRPCFPSMLRQSSMSTAKFWKCLPSLGVASSWITSRCTDLLIFNLEPLSWRNSMSSHSRTRITTPDRITMDRIYLRPDPRLAICRLQVYWVEGWLLCWCTLSKSYKSYSQMLIAQDGWTCSSSWRGLHL